MSESMLAVTLIAVLVSVSAWLSLRMAASANVAVFSTSCRRRLRWWRMNARAIYLVTASIGLVTLALNLSALPS